MSKEYVPLFQEHLKSEPFWMLVACSLVNLTKWSQAKPVFDVIYKMCNGEVRKLSEFDQEHLSFILKPLGLQNRRSKSLVKLAKAWMINSPSTKKDVLNMPGCGKYASDSWSIFIENDLSVEPKDGRLLEYLEQNSR